MDRGAGWSYTTLKAKVFQSYTSDLVTWAPFVISMLRLICYIFIAELWRILMSSSFRFDGIWCQKCNLSPAKLLRLAPLLEYQCRLWWWECRLLMLAYKTLLLIRYWHTFLFDDLIDSLKLQTNCECPCFSVSIRWMVVWLYQDKSPIWQKAFWKCLVQLLPLTTSTTSDDVWGSWKYLCLKAQGGI